MPTCIKHCDIPASKLYRKDRPLPGEPNMAELPVANRI